MVDVFIGGETSGMLRTRFQDAGFSVLSCDLLPAEDGAAYDPLTMTGHYVGNYMIALDDLWLAKKWPTLAIFHLTCTYLTSSAEWAYNDPDFDRYPGVGYHQRVKPETLTGHERRQAREMQLDHARTLIHLPILYKAFENPIGALSRVAKPVDIVQPYEFGDDASKATGLWVFDKDGVRLPGFRLPRNPTLYVQPTLRKNGKRYWANQTDTGQNRLSPGDERWKDRSRTYPGIADAIVHHWKSFLL